MSCRKEQDTPGQEKEVGLSTVRKRGVPFCLFESESQLLFYVALECGWLWEEIEHTANDNGSCPDSTVVRTVHSSLTSLSEKDSLSQI